MIVAFLAEMIHNTFRPPVYEGLPDDDRLWSQGKGRMSIRSRWARLKASLVLPSGETSEVRCKNPRPYDIVELEGRKGRQWVNLPSSASLGRMACAQP